MAAIINGALIVEQVYEFGVDVGGETVMCLDYDMAERLAKINNQPVKMRVHYTTDWMDSK